MSDRMRTTNEFRRVADVHLVGDDVVGANGRRFVPVIDMAMYGLLMEKLPLERLGKIHHSAAGDFVFTDIGGQSFTGAEHGGRAEALNLNRHDLAMYDLPDGYIWFVDADLAPGLDYPLVFEAPINIMQVYGSEVYPEAGRWTAEKEWALVKAIVNDGLVFSDDPDFEQDFGPSSGDGPGLV